MKDDRNYFEYDPIANQGTIIQDGEVWGTYYFVSKDLVVINSGNVVTDIRQPVNTLIADLLNEYGSLSMVANKELLDSISLPVKRLIFRSHTEIQHRVTIRPEDNYLFIGKNYES